MLENISMILWAVSAALYLVGVIMITFGIVIVMKKNSSRDKPELSKLLLAIFGWPIYFWKAVLKD